MGELLLRPTLLLPQIPDSFAQSVLELLHANQFGSTLLEGLQTLSRQTLDSITKVDRVKRVFKEFFRRREHNCCDAASGGLS